MRRVLVLPVLFLLVLPLCAVTVECAQGLSVDPSFISTLEKAVNRSGAGVIPPGIETITLESYSEDEQSVRVTVAGYELAFDRSDLENSIRDEVRAFFLYPPYLPPVEGSSLEYIYNSSYSTYSLEGASKGQVYDLIAPYDGDRTARFTVSRVYEDGLVELEPVKISGVHAPLRLERAPSWSLTFSFGSIFMPSWRYSLALRLRSSAILYPFNPSVGIEYGVTDYGDTYIAALAGAEYSLSLGGTLDSTFTLLQDAQLYAGADLVLGYGDGFLWGGSWRAGYRHYISRHFSWSLGVEYSVMRDEGLDLEVLRQYRALCSVGVMF